MTQRFEFLSRDGGACNAALAIPEGIEKTGAIIVVHEWYGLNDDLKRIAARFADEGFLALAVDLFDGQVATNDQDAMKLATEMKTLHAVEIIAGAATALRQLARANGHVAVTGFCLGGGMSLAAACLVSGIDAAVPFYGTPRDEYVDWTKLRVPVLAHFGAHDPMIPTARPQSIASTVNGAGGSFELHLYDAGHAFMREADPHAFHAESAALAWSRTTEFLHRMLASDQPDES